MKPRDIILLCVASCSEAGKVRHFTSRHQVQRLAIFVRLIFMRCLVILLQHWAVRCNTSFEDRFSIHRRRNYSHPSFNANAPDHLTPLQIMPWYWVESCFDAKLSSFHWLCHEPMLNHLFQNLLCLFYFSFRDYQLAFNRAASSTSHPRADRTRWYWI